MRIFRTFGIGTKTLISANCSVEGTITAVKTCYFLKVNQKPFRTTPLDGAAFPHIIRFTYQVDGTVYHGCRFLSWTLPCPCQGQTVTVFFDPRKPANYAINIS